ncbi:hypothetical protein [uncultured Sanguibacteroides sp.]|uniref:hypothetical protein n=1 Tax=uncultured Sanguibacteroides sp. TaxID=1635151 RepID=UPI0025FD0E3D|nr:hypothetical protein [uncultured Sanguibacteroides sp.]
MSTTNSARQSGELYMASQFPYTIAFLLTILQYLPLVFLSAMFFSRRKIDTLDSLYARPISNIEYYTGIGIGFIRVFMIWAMVLFFIGMLVQVFTSKAPFNPWLYFYYLITLVFPAMVFMLGLSFFVFAILRHAFAAILILFACIWATISLSGESWAGILNFSGLTLPNEYSGITGFVAVVPYLLQRLGWLSVGVGLFFCSILFCKRLENRLGERKVVGKRALAIVLLGVGCLMTVWGIYTEKYIRRDCYAAVYNRYADREKLYLLSQELEITPEGDRLKGLSRMKLMNETGEILSDFLLYLNPKLKVKSLTVKGNNVSFRREKQVIIVEKNVSPGDTLHVEMEYEGGIDEEVFYLDVPEKELRNTWNWSYKQNLCPSGKRYAYLENNQVLLNPEGLWYPVTVPPVNPASPYIVEKNFTDYKLIVHDSKDRTVISQGECQRLGESVVFDNDYFLPGISLCIGGYEGRQLSVDTIGYEFFLFKGHGIFVEAYEDVLDALPDFLSFQIKTLFELKFNRKYPFRRLIFVETPRAFATYYRNQRGGSEYVQPEIIFFPESMPPRWKDRWALNKDIHERQENYFGGGKEMKLHEIQSLLLNTLWVESMPIDYSPLKREVDRLTFRSSKPVKTSNPFFVAPLFYNYVYSFYSLDYPIIETIFNSMVKNSFDPAVAAFSFNISNYREGIRFLNAHSLKEAFGDSRIKPELMSRLVNLKTDELFTFFNFFGISTDELATYLREYISRKHFSRIDLREISREMKYALGIDLMEILSGWYHQSCLPSFIVKDIQMRRISPTGHLYDYSNDITQFIFTVYNNSEVDGFVSLSYSPESGSRVSRNYVYRIPEGEGRTITRTVYGKCFDPVLKLNLSQNYPAEFSFGGYQSSSPLIDTMSREKKISKEELFPPEEVIVDNADDGFSYGERKLSLTERWRRERQKKVAQEKDWTSFDRLNPDWQIILDNAAYGYPVRTSVVRLVANSGSKVSWTTELEREGYYEISVYIPPGIIKRAGSYMKSFKDNNAISRFSQYYTIERNGELKESSIEISDQPGWVSIGRCYCTPGVIRVSLLDKGITEQFVCADAVKWRYLGAKNE